MEAIDAHQHFWKYNSHDYGWMNDEMTVLRRDHLPEMLEPLLGAAGIQGTVAVQARQSLAETQWLLELAALHPFIRGVVGWVDLRSAGVSEELAQFSAHPKLVGVRHVLQDEVEDRFMLQPEFLRGLAALRRFSLVYDLLIYPRHLPIATTLVHQFPEQPFVLDHLAKPPIATSQIDEWRRDLRALAKCPQVSCKLSGMVTEARWNAWRPDDFRPYLEVVLDCFGPNRLMIGSDWPVCTLSGEYGSVMGLVQDFIGRLSVDERSAILGETCAKVYGLGRSKP